MSQPLLKLCIQLNSLTWPRELNKFLLKRKLFWVATFGHESVIEMLNISQRVSSDLLHGTRKTPLLSLVLLGPTIEKQTMDLNVNLVMLSYKRFAGRCSSIFDINKNAETLISLVSFDPTFIKERAQMKLAIIDNPFEIISSTFLDGPVYSPCVGENVNTELEMVYKDLPLKLGLCWSLEPQYIINTKTPQIVPLANCIKLTVYSLLNVELDGEAELLNGVFTCHASWVWERSISSKIHMHPSRTIKGQLTTSKETVSVGTRLRLFTITFQDCLILPLSYNSLKQPQLYLFFNLDGTTLSKLYTTTIIVTKPKERMVQCFQTPSSVHYEIEFYPFQSVLLSQVPKYLDNEYVDYTPLIDGYILDDVRNNSLLYHQTISPKLSSVGDVIESLNYELKRRNIDFDITETYYFNTILPIIEKNKNLLLNADFSEILNMIEELSLPPPQEISHLSDTDQNSDNNELYALIEEWIVPRWPTSATAGTNFFVDLTTNKDVTYSTSQITVTATELLVKDEFSILDSQIISKPHVIKVTKLNSRHFLLEFLFFKTQRYEIVFVVNKQPIFRDKIVIVASSIERANTILVNSSDTLACPGIFTSKQIADLSKANLSVDILKEQSKRRADFTIKLYDIHFNKIRYGGASLGLRMNEPENASFEIIDDQNGDYRLRIAQYVSLIVEGANVSISSNPSPIQFQLTLNGVVTSNKKSYGIVIKDYAQLKSMLSTFLATAELSTDDHAIVDQIVSLVDQENFEQPKEILKKFCHWDGKDEIILNMEKETQNLLQQENMDKATREWVQLRSLFVCCHRLSHIYKTKSYTLNTIRTELTRRHFKKINHTIQSPLISPDAESSYALNNKIVLNEASINKIVKHLEKPNLDLWEIINLRELLAKKLWDCDYQQAAETVRQSTKFLIAYKVADKKKAELAKLKTKVEKGEQILEQEKNINLRLKDRLDEIKALPDPEEVEPSIETTNFSQQTGLTQTRFKEWREHRERYNTTLSLQIVKENASILDEYFSHLPVFQKAVWNIFLWHTNSVITRDLAQFKGSRLRVADILQIPELKLSEAASKRLCLSLGLDSPNADICFVKTCAVSLGRRSIPVSAYMSFMTGICRALYPNCSLSLALYYTLEKHLIPLHAHYIRHAEYPDYLNFKQSTLETDQVAMYTNRSLIDFLDLDILTWIINIVLSKDRRYSSLIRFLVLQDVTGMRSLTAVKIAQICSMITTHLENYIHYIEYLAECDELDNKPLTLGEVEAGATRANVSIPYVFSNEKMYKIIDNRMNATGLDDYSSSISGDILKNHPIITSTPIPFVKILRLAREFMIVPNIISKDRFVALYSDIMTLLANNDGIELPETVFSEFASFVAFNRQIKEQVFSKMLTEERNTLDANIYTFSLFWSAIAVAASLTAEDESNTKNRHISDMANILHLDTENSYVKLLKKLNQNF